MMIYFKMKVEPERHRETQLQYFGKAGMSWHGAGIFYKPDKSRDLCYKERMREFDESKKRRRNETAAEKNSRADLQNEGGSIVMCFLRGYHNRKR